MAQEIKCPECKLPLAFTPRALVQTPDGRQRISPALYCGHCEHAEEWPGYDLIAVTHDAIELLAAARQVLAQQGGPQYFVDFLSHAISRFTAQINTELGRITRIRLGKE